ncbi:MAG TPA: RNA methyltransferase [Terriglobia bacterium]|nr:RNA methyltransferase [Terriglobia bacterium]
MIKLNAMPSDPVILEWRMILVRPRNPLNMGAAARAMANFGFRDLAIAAPYEPSWQETRSAVGAEDVIRNAHAVATLSEALRGVALAVGTTSGQRRKFDRELISLEDLPQWLRQQDARGRAAMLFGSEKTGLSNEDLSYCHAVVRIPTVTRCPSMNLGQAVAVCCYELARWRSDHSGQQSEGAEPVPDSPPSAQAYISPPAGIQSLEHLFERAARVLDEAGYLKPKSRAATLLKLRRMLIERRLSSNEAKILGGVLAQIEWKLRLTRRV